MKSKKKALMRKQRRKFQNLRGENDRLRAELKRTRAIQAHSCLTSAQQQALATGRRVTWSEKDIGTALGLRVLSRRAYAYVKDVMKVPLPAFSTLSEWTRHFQMAPGVIGTAMGVLEATAKDFTVAERHCVVAFDEIGLDSRIGYDQARDQIIGASKMQVVMVRGLASSWKQPVYYGFDEAMTADTLLIIIVRLEAIGLLVIAAVSDMATPNQRVWTDLGVTSAFLPTPHQTWFANPASQDRRVWVFADTPHLLKLLRHHVLETGMRMEDGTALDVTSFNAVLKLQATSELRACHKLTPLHVTFGKNPSRDCDQCSDPLCRAALCTVCREEADTPRHVLLRCPALMRTRLHLMGSITPNPEDTPSDETVAAPGAAHSTLQSRSITPP